MASKPKTIRVVAITFDGQEQTFRPYTAHRVSAKSAERIRDELNRNGYRLCAEGMKWELYTVSEFTNAFRAAQNQTFTIRNGYMYETGCENY